MVVVFLVETNAYEICAEKSTVKPMHTTKMIMEIESNLTPYNAMKPVTPVTNKPIENVTHREQSGFGINNKETTNMTAVVKPTFRIVAVTMTEY